MAINGVTDFISSKNQTVSIHNGTALLPKITGSGCLLSAVCTAFLAVANKDDYFNAVLEACASYAVTGELISKTLLITETGTFTTKFIDQLAAITPEEVMKHAKIEY